MERSRNGTSKQNNFPLLIANTSLAGREILRLIFVNLRKFLSTYINAYSNEVISRTIKEKREAVLIRKLKQSISFFSPI